MLTVTYHLHLEYIMSETLDGFGGSVSIGGRTITNLQFADDIGLVARLAEELSTLTSTLEKCAKQLEKIKVMKMGSNDELDVLINGENLETVTQFKSIGATITEDARLVQEIKISIAVATSSLSKHKTIWRDKHISMKTRMNLLLALVTSVFLFGCETWTLNAKIGKTNQLF